MLQRLLQFSIANRYLVVVTTVVFALMGAMSV